MSCPYFKEGYAGVCIASESIYVPSIARMEIYCFTEHYELCPNLADRGITSGGAETKGSLQDSPP